MDQWSRNLKKTAAEPMQDPDNSLGGLAGGLGGLSAQVSDIKNESARQEIEPIVSQAIAAIVPILKKYHDLKIGFGDPYQVEQFKASRERTFERLLGKGKPTTSRPAGPLPPASV